MALSSCDLTTLLVLIFAGIYLRGDRNDRISWVYIFTDLPSKCCKNPENYLIMREFSKITFFAGTNSRELCQKPQNSRKLILSKQCLCKKPTTNGLLTFFLVMVASFYFASPPPPPHWPLLTDILCHSPRFTESANLVTV